MCDARNNNCILFAGRGLEEAKASAIQGFVVSQFLLSRVGKAITYSYHLITFYIRSRWYVHIVVNGRFSSNNNPKRRMATEEKKWLRKKEACRSSCY
jgi:hypothetical protein